MATGLLIELTYKASHFVSRLDHPVHSNPHYHTWEVVLRVAGQIDAHEVQEWMHHTAPHFGDHGDMGVEDIADWWLEHAIARWHADGSPLRVLGVKVMREDGIGAFSESD
ncbi:MAG: hypothetical protein KDB32_00165 [Planctomycetes bacterium]|nr:hypothetical protein [Planctomycetota bacterium]MCA8946623.1 hypothetical protein [Planctomycetota bacterium]